jgi:DeoR family glycerol-3-phosphate regulon repressor
MRIDERQSAILDILKVQFSVEVEALSSSFGVTNQTIRQDLRELDERGLLKRTHGGARRLAHVAGRAYADRRGFRGQEKRAIGELAASLIPNNCSLTLNIGTTTEQVARAVQNHSDLMVISNNINIINMLSGSKDKELVLVGGKVRQSDGAVVGEDAVEFINRYKVDYAVIGASSLDTDGSVLDFDAQEVSVARAILRNARTRILVADASKFEVSAPVRICEVAEVDYVITDAAPPHSFASAANAAQTKVLVADSAGVDRVHAAV